LAIVGITASQIQATVSGSLVATAGTANVSVFNPPAPQAGTGNGGGGTSQASLPFTIAATACPAGAARAAAAVQTVGETPAVSTDGRFVAYTASQDGHAQVFVRDTCQGAIEACQVRTLLVSSAVDGAAGNDDSGSPSMSADGRYIAFSSAATNLLPEAPPGSQIYLRDTCLNVRTPCAPVTQLVSTDAQGALAGTEAILPSISASGRFVTFVAVTPSQGANSRFRQVFVRDTCLATSNCTPTTVRTP
jgi:Tol biopolymer transport system component